MSSFVPKTVYSISISHFTGQHNLPSISKILKNWVVQQINAITQVYVCLCLLLDICTYYVTFMYLCYVGVIRLPNNITLSLHCTKVITLYLHSNVSLDSICDLLYTYIHTFVQMYICSQKSVILRPSHPAKVKFTENQFFEDHHALSKWKMSNITHNICPLHQHPHKVEIVWNQNFQNHHTKL